MPHRRKTAAPGRWLVTVMLAAAPSVIAGCSANTGAAPSTLEAATTPSSTGPRTPTPSPAPRAGAQAPDPSVQVDWHYGMQAPGMQQGVPNPPGWYDAAFGGPTTEKVLYVTYDDGPEPGYTTRILKLLKQYHAKATFFVLGRQVQKNPGLVRKIAAAGHALGDHTQNHSWLTNLPRTRVREELSAVQREVGPNLGPCMRPPAGLINNRVASVAKSLDLTPILWTGHAEDWNVHPVPTMVRWLKAATHPGAVLLLHDTSGPGGRTIAATAKILPWWRSQGYRLVTVPACTVAQQP